MRDFGHRSTSWLLEHEARIARPDFVPVPVELASTVMLVRPGAGASGLDVFLQRRVASMEFAPSMLVFPGGRVDPRDAREDVEWAGRSPKAWAATLGTDVPEARLLVTAAIRELFEESGVLLAGPGPDALVADVGSPLWHERRMGLIRHELSLAEVLATEGLVLRSDLLAYRAHWVTPVFESKRYDTRFFAATVPAGQQPDGRTSEADHADWADPAETLAALERREVLMLPPTIVCLEDLARVGDVDEVTRDAADVSLVLPELVREGDHLVLRCPLPEQAGR